MSLTTNVVVYGASGHTGQLVAAEPIARGNAVEQLAAKRLLAKGMEKSGVLSPAQAFDAAELPGALSKQGLRIKDTALAPASQGS